MNLERAVFDRIEERWASSWLRGEGHEHEHRHRHAEGGPELDALVAEQVMGFTWDESRCRVCGWPLKEKLEDGCVPENCSLRPGPVRRADSPPRYSTELLEAWKIVDKEHLCIHPRVAIRRSTGSAIRVA